MASAMIAKGKKKYEAKIKALGGASAYRSCGEKGGIEVAICLKGLKEKLTETDWANAWEIFNLFGWIPKVAMKG